VSSDGLDRAWADPVEALGLAVERSSPLDEAAVWHNDMLGIMLTMVVQAVVWLAAARWSG
jgi:hypothetical protein